MLTKYVGDNRDIGDSASLGKQHRKISLVWDKNPTYLQVRLVRDQRTSGSDSCPNSCQTPRCVDPEPTSLQVSLL